jgi:hypothetical protein
MTEASPRGMSGARASVSRNGAVRLTWGGGGGAGGGPGSTAAACSLRPPAARLCGTAGPPEERAPSARRAAGLHLNEFVPRRRPLGRTGGARREVRVCGRGARGRGRPPPGQAGQRRDRAGRAGAGGSSGAGGCGRAAAVPTRDGAGERRRGGGDARGRRRRGESGISAGRTQRCAGARCCGRRPLTRARGRAPGPLPSGAHALLTRAWTRSTPSSRSRRAGKPAIWAASARSICSSAGGGAACCCSAGGGAACCCCGGGGGACCCCGGGRRQSVPGSGWTRSRPTTRYLGRGKGAAGGQTRPGSVAAAARRRHCGTAHGVRRHAGLPEHAPGGADSAPLRVERRRAGVADAGCARRARDDGDARGRAARHADAGRLARGGAGREAVSELMRKLRGSQE